MAKYFPFKACSGCTRLTIKSKYCCASCKYGSGHNDNCNARQHDRRDYEPGDLCPPKLRR